MNDSNHEAEKWFWVPMETSRQMMDNGNWPFENVTMEQFLQCYDSLNIKRQVQSILRVTGGMINAFGILFSLLIMGTVWRKAFVEKNTFYAAMLAISVLDLAFSVIDMIFNVCYRAWKITGYTSYWLMWMVAVCRGLVFGLSLASDMCALCVTVERYFAIAHPQFYRNLSGTFKRHMWIAVVVVALIISATRMHYTLATQVEAVGGIYIYTSSELGAKPFVIGMAMFSDTILPIILVVVMAVLSTRLRLALIKRHRLKSQRKAKVTPANNNVVEAGINSPQDLEVPMKMEDGPACTAGQATGNTNQRLESATPNANSHDQSDQRSIVALTLALDILLILDNLSYCVYFAGELLIAQSHISYKSTLSQISDFCFGHRFESYAVLCNVIVECLTRTLNFPIYVALSGTMRAEFLAFVKRMWRMS